MPKMVLSKARMMLAPKARFIAHLDIDVAEIGKIKHVNWYHAGNLKRALADLTDLAKALGLLRDAVRLAAALVTLAAA